ncbi:MAG: UvrD-helicase domain-containing protein [Pseudomonadota bacterium]
MRKPKDQKNRDMIVQKLDASMLIEAGAGSGKTTSLVDRMLALIGEGSCTVDRMAAVTFTRKAAAELKGRFQIALEDIVKEEKDQARRERYQTALAGLNLLFTGTIHSFCARLLRERPVEARLDPDFEELEEEENTILRDQCWAEYVEGLYAEGAPILNEIMELGLDPANLVETYRNVALYPEVEAIRNKEARPDFSREKALLREYLAFSYKALPKKVPEKGWDSLQKIIRQARLRVRHLDMNQDRDFIKVLTGLEKSPGITQYKWPGGKDTAKDQLAAFDKFRQEVVDPSLEQWRRYCHYFIMELVMPAVEYFEKVRQKDSLMNYNDLLLKSAELLRENEEVRRYFQERFTHLLVDEFQDTDPIQAEVIMYLTGEDVEEKSWRSLKVRPGSLFIVGDPKQSIYRFRRADIDTYNEVKRIIKDSGGLIIPLTTNFRSLPAVCEWINPVFKAKFPAEATQYQPAFERLDPFKDMKNGGVKRITIDKIKYNPQREIALQDAERIASFIDWALKGDLDISRTEEELKKGEKQKTGPGDFMILLRYKEHLPVYARALEAHGIHYEVSGGGAFNESEELRHLLNLLATVADPEDQVSLIATLRGIFYGISDDLLYRFRAAGGFFSYLAGQEKCVDEEAKERIGSVLSEIGEFYRWSRTKPPAAALSMILDHLGIVPLAMTRDMGESRAGNLLKAAEIALWESGKTLNSFPDMVERLEQYYTELDVEEMSIEPGKENVVRIMNLHKAKGLEAPVVFLADPLKEVSHEPSLHIARMEDRAVGYFVASNQKGEFQREAVGLPPNWQEYERLEQAYQQAEEERLLYVATTRAKQLLVVSMYPEKLNKGGWKDLYPYLIEVEELEALEDEEAPPVIPEGKISPESFAEGSRQIAERISTGKLHSYKSETVTKASKDSDKKVPFSEDTGRGMSWGRIIHKMLEILARGEPIDLELIAENLLKEEERPLSERDEVVAAVKAVASSELWKRMKRATEALVEVPFSLKIEGEELPRIISGAIDLAFKEPEGWVIADYKTDKVDGNLDSLIAYYKPQVEMYRDFWQKMSGENVKEVGLYFVGIGKWERIY